MDTRVAIVGLACAFAGADRPEQFWRNLLAGKDSITRVSGPAGVAARGLLKAPEWFDAGYFGISPREARLINPQQRLFLEYAAAALEDAGHDPVRHDGAVGVYAGSGDNQYAQLLKDNRATLPPVSDWEIRVANGHDFLCARTAHRLGLGGPSVVVQAACATSLLAVHLAAQGLLNGDCDLALAGGVTVRIPTGPGSGDDIGIQAPDGICRAFDADARGLVGGDGIGIVVLKRFADALADGDRIDAVLLGSAVNNDGAGRMGFTAPGITGQAAVIQQAQRAAGVTPQSCTYIETHGTGTPLGDPIEIAALTKAFWREDGGAGPVGSCGIGSVKTNIGHTDAAAGVAGLIKTVLALKHAVIPPSLHFTEPNPQIDFAAGPFRVVTRAQPWRPEGQVRRAGVSAFSVGGTNVHIVLEQAPEDPRKEPDTSADGPHVLPLGARTPEALQAVTARLAEHLGRHPDTPLADVAWTLQTGRREHPCRRIALVHDITDAIRVLSGAVPERLVTAPGPARPAGAPEPTHAQEFTHAQKPAHAHEPTHGQEPTVAQEPAHAQKPAHGQEPAHGQDGPEAAGRRWLAGGVVDWAALHGDRKPRRTALPTYPFERRLFTVKMPAPATTPKTRPPAGHTTPTAGSPGHKTPGGTYEVIGRLFAEILELPDVEPDESFFDLGGDSLIATRLVARVRERFPIELAPKELLSAPTAEEFAALVDARLAQGRAS
jgi:phthiocerol/phenolphthiocerol synthesis type-I polyketide synthase E